MRRKDQLSIYARIHKLKKVALGMNRTSTRCKKIKKILPVQSPFLPWFSSSAQLPSNPWKTPCLQKQNPQTHCCLLQAFRPHNPKACSRRCSWFFRSRIASCSPFRRFFPPQFLHRLPIRLSPATGGGPPMDSNSSPSAAPPVAAEAARYTYSPRLRWQPEVEEYFASAYGRDHFARISEALAWALPATSCCLWLFPFSPLIVYCWF